MNKILSIFLYLVAVILSGLNIIFIKTFKDHIFLYITISSFFIYLITTFIVIYKHGSNSGKVLKEAYQGNNPLYSFLTLGLIGSGDYGTTLLPVSVSVPVSKLNTPSSFIFDYILNGNPLTIFRIVSIILIFIGSIIVNFDQILGKNIQQKIATQTYLIGIGCLMTYAILAGYLFNIYYDKTVENGSYETLNSSDMVPVMIMIPSYIILSYMKYLPRVSIKKLLEIAGIALCFSSFPVILKYGLYQDLSEIIIILLNAFGIIISIFMGWLFLGEKLTFYKIAGITTVISGIMVYVESAKLRNLFGS